ncbi:MAG: hypothetical protein QM817_13970 [Archangium sp.]
MIYFIVGVVVIAVLFFLLRGSGGAPTLGAGQRVGTRGWEAALTLDPLHKTIALRRASLATATDEKAKDRLTREIAFLEAQIPELDALVAARDASPGLGYIGFKQLPPD